MRGEAGADRDGKLSHRRDISGDDGRGERRVIVLGCIDQAVEGGAVAASRAMGGLSRDIVMSMNDMGHGIQRERQQQADEGDSQPGGRFSGQMKYGHIRTVGRSEPVGQLPSAALS